MMAANTGHGLISTGKIKAPYILPHTPDVEKSLDSSVIKSAASY
jgi:hypothetical protein